MSDSINTALNALETKCLSSQEHQFSKLIGFDYAAKFIDSLPSFGAMRMAYIDESPHNNFAIAPNGRVALCLHGEPTWSYLYRKMIPQFLAAGYRVVAPDLFGFGRSDKPVDPSWFTFTAHRKSLIELIESLNLRNITLVVQDWGGLLGLTLPHQLPERFSQLLVLNTTLATAEAPLSDGFKAWRTYMAGQKSLNVQQLMQRACPHLSSEEQLGYAMPFSFSSDKDSAASLGGVMRFPALVPEFSTDDGAEISRQAESFFRNHWAGDSFMAIGMKDPVLGPAVMRALQQKIRGCPEPLEIASGGHFLQEWETGDSALGRSIVASALASWSC